MAPPFSQKSCEHPVSGLRSVLGSTPRGVTRSSWTRARQHRVPDRVCIGKELSRGPSRARALPWPLWLWGEGCDCWNGYKGLELLQEERGEKLACSHHKELTVSTSLEKAWNLGWCI